MVAPTRRRYLSTGAASLGWMLAAACRWGDLQATTRGSADTPSQAVLRARAPRPPPASPLRQKGPMALRVLFGPWNGPLIQEHPIPWIGPDGEPIAPQQELYRTAPFATFEARHRHSLITLDIASDPLPVARAAHAAGQAPDIFLVDDRRAQQVIRLGMAETLDGRMRQWPDHPDFAQPALEAGRLDHQQWGLPLFTFVYTLFYNKPLLHALGFLRLPTTWGELLTVAEQSTRVEGNRVARQGITGPDVQWFWWLLQSTGATLYEGGRAGIGSEAEEILLFLRHLYHAVRPKGVTPLPSAGGLSPGRAYFTSQRNWNVGATAHAWLPQLPRPTPEQARQHQSEVLTRLLPPPPPDATPPPGIATVLPAAIATAKASRGKSPAADDIAIGTTPVPGNLYHPSPRGQSRQPLVHTHTAVLHLSPQSAYPDEAWELLNLLLEPDILYDYANLRRAMLPRKSILDQGYLGTAKVQRVIDLWLRHGRPPFNPPEYAKVSREIENTFRRVVVRQLDVHEEVRDLTKKLDKIAEESDPPYTGTTRH